jgi:hypothetical protein
MRKSQKRPTVEARETYYRGKGDLLYKKVTQYIAKQNKVVIFILTQHADTMMTAPEVLKRCLFMLPATNSAKSVALVYFPYKHHIEGFSEMGAASCAQTSRCLI